MFTPAQRAAFDQALVPLSDVAIGPYVQYHDYSSRFVDVLDSETLALTENFRRGHEVLLHVGPISTTFNSSRNYIDLFASAAYTVPMGDGLVRGVAPVERRGDHRPPSSTAAANRAASPTAPSSSTCTS